MSLPEPRRPGDHGRGLWFAVPWIGITLGLAILSAAIVTLIWFLRPFAS